jgi:hypothetical protein
MKESDALERSLRLLKPASLPPALRKRLENAVQSAHAPTADSQVSELRGWLRWLFPLGATVAAAALLLLTVASAPRPAALPPAELLADEVVIGQTLVAAFETVTRLSDTAPLVRLRWEQWVDDLVLRDSLRGIAIEERRPRLEVFPVGFEIY